MVAVLTVPAQAAIPLVSGIWDKLIHFLAYGLFGVLCLRAFHGGMNRLRWYSSVLAMTLTIGFGFIDEWHQSMVPGRYSSLPDWIADALGALGAVAIFALWVHRGSPSA